MTSDETAVAQVCLELLQANSELSLFQIAIEHSDTELQLPAIVVSARHQEDTRIFMSSGKEVKQYAVTIEVRGIQLDDAAIDLDAAIREIDKSLHPPTPQSVPSGSLFQGIMIDTQTTSDSTLPSDARIRSVGYDLFAVKAA
jgi:hypothetical protein